MEDLFLIDQSTPGNPIQAKFNDLEIADYDLVTVDGPTRKAQDLIKGLMTGQGNNLVYPSYGTLLSKTPGKRVPSEFNDLLSDSTKEIVMWLQKQEDSPRPDEQLSRIISLSVSNGPTSSEKNVYLVVELRDGQTVKTNFSVSL